MGIFLFVCSVTDIKFMEINKVVLLVFALAGSILYLIYRPVSFFEEVLGLLIGAVFIGLWALTEGKIGLGDGLMMIVTGIYLGARENGSLLMTAMLFSAVFSVFCMAVKKADKNTRFPFAPFILASFLFHRVILLF